MREKFSLEKAWAENEVAAAQVPISNVDAIIGWFKGNPARQMISVASYCCQT